MQSPILDSSQYPGNITIPDGTGQQWGGYLAKALLTVQSNFSSASDPATVSGLTVLPFMTWDDTGNNIRKMRNQANNGWISLIDLITGNLLTNAATATLANAAKGDTRFQRQFQLLTTNTSFPAQSESIIFNFYINIPSGKSLVLKNIQYNVSNNSLVHWVIQANSIDKYETSDNKNHLNTNIVLCSTTGLQAIGLAVKNTSSITQPIYATDNIWIDLSLE